jgi:acyl-CoA synthetase (NDP forming)
MQLEALFRPKSVAVIGASDMPTIGRRLLVSLARIGFKGAIYPVNLNYSTVLGQRCWPNLAQLPEAPDLALFCVGHGRVLDAVTAAAGR